MENLFFCLNATVPIFLTLVLGFCFQKCGLLNEAFTRGLNKFVFTAALPALLFQDISGADVSHVWDGTLVLFCFGATFLSILISFVLSLFLKDKSLQGEFVQASYRSSAAILGMAFIQNIYGTSVMGPLMIIGTVPLYNVMAVVILSLLNPQTHSLDRTILRKTFRQILTNPIILGIAAGLIWSLLEIPQPAILSKTVSNLAVLATPLGLMAMGASFEPQKAFSHIKASIFASILKLLGFPALFLPIAISMGFTRDKLISILVMLGSATTVSCFIMAKNMGHKGQLTSSIVIITTFFSAFTLTAWLYLCKTMGLV